MFNLVLTTQKLNLVRNYVQIVLLANIQIVSQPETT